MATFTMPHIRIQASGTLGTGAGNEIWTFGYKVGCVATGGSGVLEIPTQDDLQTACDAAKTAVSALISHSGGGAGPGGLISSWGALTSVKASAIGPDSKVQSDKNTVIEDVIPAVRGAAALTSGGDTFWETPYQVAVVATLRGTQYTRGPAAFGRFYLPVPNLFNNSGESLPTTMINGLMGVAAVTNFANACAAMVTANSLTDLSSGYFHHVANISSSQVQSEVRWQPVTAVSVDNRPDTVRRRSNKLSGQGEVRVTVA